jgi:hypothetical protein
MFFTFCPENSDFFSGNPKARFKNFQNQVSRFMCQLAKHAHAKFQRPSFYPDGLRHIFDHIPRKIQDILKKISSFSNFNNSSK